MKYAFTCDWGVCFRRNAEKIFSPYKGQPITYLEIGVWEGRSMCWMFDNILTHPDSRAVAVEFKMRENGWANLERHMDRLTVYEGDSKLIVPRLGEKFDLIYIDGDHSAKGVMFDSVACWKIAKDIILWDDYTKTDNGCEVKKGLDHFFACIPSNEYTVLVDNEQYAVKKR